MNIEILRLLRLLLRDARHQTLMCAAVVREADACFLLGEGSGSTGAQRTAHMHSLATHERISHEYIRGLREASTDAIERANKRMRELQKSAADYCVPCLVRA